MNSKKNQEASSAKVGGKKVGTVVSDKMDKTVVVEVATLKAHSKYKKMYKASKRYKAHDEENKLKVGDKVVITECKPVSKDKRWTAAAAE